MGGHKPRRPQRLRGVSRAGPRRPRGLLFAAASWAAGGAGWGPRLASAISSDACWVGGWTPEICCSAPGAKGNPLCWDHIYTYDKCCTETEEGIQFDLRRRNFVSDMVRRGATVHFDIRHVSGGRTGAVASRALSSRSTVLRVPSDQVYSLKAVPFAMSEAAKRHNCDAHAVLALGLALERVNPVSTLQDWIRLLPTTFANVLWFSEKHLQLVNGTFFSYLIHNWFGDLDCMRRAADEVPAGTWRGRRASFEDLRWALSVVKTRGFAFEGTRESTMLIPLADFLNHNMVASVRTATLADDALRFVATRNIMPGEELCIDYAQASNLEFLVRYGFRVEDNPYGGRQFDLGGEPLQAHCPSYIVRYDTPDIVENATVDCHRQARYLSFEEQFGSLQLHEQLREDRYIYRAVEEACMQLLSMLEMPRSLSEYEADSYGADSITSVLLREIRAERVLLQRCVQEFQRRQQDTEPRPVPATLAAPLARLRGQPVADNEASASPQPPGQPGSFGADAGVAFGPAGSGHMEDTATGPGGYGANAGFNAFGFNGYAAGVSQPAGAAPAGFGAAGFGATGFGSGPAGISGAGGAGGAGLMGGMGSGVGAGGAASFAVNPDGTTVFGGMPAGAGGFNGPGRAPYVPGNSGGYAGAFGIGAGGASAQVGGMQASAASSAPGSAAVGIGPAADAFTYSVDRARVDQLLARLQQGMSIS